MHRRMYDWVLSWAHSRFGTPALALLSFAESSFFPIPPDVLQIALTLERRSRAFFYALVSAAASVAGGLLGYLIGWGLWGGLQGLFIPHLFGQGAFDRVGAWYQHYDFWIIFIAAFTPIPYKVFTIAAGVFGVGIPGFLLASAIGRSARFFLVALLLYHYGEPMKRFIEKYFNLLTLLAGAALVGAVVLLRVL
ncbi:MAG: DedA family protein [Phycisphaeraceae bacterium]|nr:DedA family protein [Phycisphaeraceae bacterium]